MAGLYGASGGVNHLPRQWNASAAAVNRDIKEVYGVSGGANRKIFSRDPTWQATSDIPNIPAFYPTVSSSNDMNHWSDYFQSFYYNGKIYYMLGQQYGTTESYIYLYVVVYNIASKSYLYKNLYYVASGSNYDGCLWECACDVVGNIAYLVLETGRYDDGYKWQFLYCTLNLDTLVLSSTISLTALQSSYNSRLERWRYLGHYNNQAILMHTYTTTNQSMGFGIEKVTEGATPSMGSTGVNMGDSLMGGVPLVGCVYNNCAYVIFKNYLGVIRFLRYNLDNNTITELSHPLSTLTVGISPAAILDGCMYFSNGSNLCRYDINSNTWQLFNHSPRSLNYITAASDFLIATVLATNGGQYTQTVSIDKATF